MDFLRSCKTALSCKFNQRGIDRKFPMRKMKKLILISIVGLSGCSPSSSSDIQRINPVTEEYTISTSPNGLLLHSLVDSKRVAYEEARNFCHNSKNNLFITHESITHGSIRSGIVTLNFKCQGAYKKPVKIGRFILRDITPQPPKKKIVEKPKARPKSGVLHYNQKTKKLEKVNPPSGEEAAIYTGDKTPEGYNVFRRPDGSTFAVVPDYSKMTDEELLEGF